MGDIHRLFRDLCHDQHDGGWRWYHIPDLRIEGYLVSSGMGHGTLDSQNTQPREPIGCRRTMGEGSLLASSPIIGETHPAEARPRIPELASV